eukprot:CAMPEP_0178992522 /NCGR_PEP_ID=MMETSP0795-20121207/6164_1 /TAXON_ID=88552 /ORGANISM="Amoebophrya sp., Strain Ameob2" /LENGTH=476 /DNA_ID=CAMNT_0020684419 /DNA_START=360 /DNA_END=1790 /DNA_ORIENTATION=+
MSVAPESTSPDSTTTCVDLLENEGWAYMYLDGVTTVTFFDGAIPAQWIKDRLVSIVQASPWVAGRLAPSKGGPGAATAKGKPQLCFTSTLAPDEILGSLLQEVNDLDLSHTMPYEELVTKLKKHPSKPHIPLGWTLLEKKLPCVKVTIAKGTSSGAATPGVGHRSSSSSWALILSISHVVADGYTYYKLLSMFSEKVEVESLDPVRKHEFIPAMKKAVGEAEYNTVMGAPSLIVNYLGNMFFGKKPRVRAFYVDPLKIEAAKLEAKKNVHSGVEFVSANDILTAWWGRLTKARIVEMAVNFRGRLKADPNLRETDAGNYEGCILFSPDDCKDPAMIRKAAVTDGRAVFLGVGPAEAAAGLLGDDAVQVPNYLELGELLHADRAGRLRAKAAHPIPGAARDAHGHLYHLPPDEDTLGVYIVTRKIKDDDLLAGANGAEPILGRQIMAEAKTGGEGRITAGAVVMATLGEMAELAENS